MWKTGGVRGHLPVPPGALRDEGRDPGFPPGSVTLLPRGETLLFEDPQEGLFSR